MVATCLCSAGGILQVSALCVPLRHLGEQIFCAVITACEFLSVWLAGFHVAILPTPCLTRPLTAGDLSAALQQLP